jgi:hypothetical protein
MTQDEAAKLTNIIGRVDGGCSVCVRGAVQRLMRDFPEIDWRPLIKDFAVRKNEYWRDEVDGWKAADSDWDEDYAD